MVSVLCSRMQVTVLSPFFFSLVFANTSLISFKEKKNKKKEQCLGLRGGHLNTRLLLPVPQLRHKWLIPAEEPPFTFSYFLCIFFNSVISTIIFYIMEFFAFSCFSEVSSVFCTFYDISSIISTTAVGGGSTNIEQDIPKVIGSSLDW